MKLPKFLLALSEVMENDPKQHPITPDEAITRQQAQEAMLEPGELEEFRQEINQLKLGEDAKRNQGQHFDRQFEYINPLLLSKSDLVLYRKLIYKDLTAEELDSARSGYVQTHQDIRTKHDPMLNYYAYLGNKLGILFGRRRLLAMKMMKQETDKGLDYQLESFHDEMRRIKELPPEDPKHDNHFEHISPGDLTIEDAEVYEKLKLSILGSNEHAKMATRPDVEGVSSRIYFYQYIGNQLHEQLLKKSKAQT